MDQIFEMDFNNITPDMIVRHHGWFWWETEYFKRIYPFKTIEELAAIFKKSTNTIRRKAWDEGFERKGIVKVEADSIIEIPEINPEDIVKHFGWLPGEIKLFIRLYPDTTNYKLADIFKKSVSVIEKRGMALNLRKTMEHLRTMGDHKCGPENDNFKGFTDTGKYMKVYCPGHPKAHNNYVLEHILIMEKKLGRYLKPNEYVKHRDGNGKNNDIENLELIVNEEYMPDSKWPNSKNITVDQIMELKEKGYMVEGIINKLGITYNTYYRILRKSNITIKDIRRHPISYYLETGNKIHELQEKGYKQKEIVDMLKLSQYRFRKSYNLYNFHSRQVESKR